MTVLRRLRREPLLHFLLLGGLLFLYFEWRGGSAGPGGTRISITPGLVEHLAAGFARTWQRPPTDAELKGLVDEYVKEEIADREAMPWASTATTRSSAGACGRSWSSSSRTRRQAPPTDAELQLARRASRGFPAEPRVALRQVFVTRAPRRVGPRGRREAAGAAEGRRAGAATERLATLDAARGAAARTLSEVSADVRSEFAGQVDDARAGAVDGSARVPRTACTSCW